MKQLDRFTLLEDLNPIITKGMEGTILDIYNSEYVEIEFVKKNGSNYEYNGIPTFTVNINQISIIKE